jgi:hypothetical protein
MDHRVASDVARHRLKAGPSSPDEVPRDGRQAERDRIDHYARWFIRMRWIVVVLAAALVVIAVHVVESVPRAAFGPLVAVVTLLALCRRSCTSRAGSGTHSRC